MADNFVGEIRAFPFNFAPNGWALCQGQILAISQNTALFSLLGTFYGGDGKSTFALPDLQGRTAISFGSGAGLSPIFSPGETGGAESVLLNAGNLPSHTHSLAQPIAPASTTKNAVGVAPGPTVTNSYETSAPALGATFDTAPAGGGTDPLALRPPYLVLNYCIALVGIFPSRS